MENEKWVPVLEVFEERMGAGSAAVTSDQKQCIVMQRGVPVLIVQEVPNNDLLFTAHFRASLTPNIAAFLGATLYIAADYVMGENFDIDEDTNKWLYGAEAVAHSIKTKPQILEVSGRLQAKMPEKLKTEQTKKTQTTKDGKLLN